MDLKERSNGFQFPLNFKSKSRGALSKLQKSHTLLQEMYSEFSHSHGHFSLFINEAGQEFDQVSILEP